MQLKEILLYKNIKISRPDLKKNREEINFFNEISEEFLTTWLNVILLLAQYILRNLFKFLFFENTSIFLIFFFFIKSIKEKILSISKKLFL